MAFGQERRNWALEETKKQVVEVKILQEICGLLMQRTAADLASIRQPKAAY